MTLDRFIAEFGETIGIDGLSLDGSGQCQLAVGGDVVVDLLGDRRDGRLLASSLVGELPEDGAERVMRRLLEANCMLADTAGATLGVAEGSDAVVLARSFDVARETPASFGRTLAAFADAAGRLRPLLVAQMPVRPDADRAGDDALIFRG